MRAFTPEVVTDPRPCVAVRWDDGSYHQLEDAKWAVHYRIPHGFCVNWQRLLDFEGANLDRDERLVSDRFTPRQLKAHLERAARAGVPVSIIQHTNNNWALHGTNPGDPDSYTWAEILAEVDPSAIEDALGVKVSIYLQPGDAHAKYWAWAHADLIKDACARVGLEYAMGLHPAQPISGGHGVDGHGFQANDIHYGFWNADAPSANLWQTYSGVRPGLYRDPYGLPEAWTVDLGSTVVPRGVWTGSEVGPDPNSGAPGWLLGRDNGRGSADGTLAGDVDNTLQWRIARYLSLGLSFGIGLHGERRTNETVAVTLSDGTVIRDGHFSVRHLCSILRRLEDAGFIRLVTYEELLDHWLGRYAHGLDLIPEAAKTFTDPMTAIGESTDAVGEIPWPAGMTDQMTGLSSWPASSSYLFFLSYSDDDGDNLIENPTTLANLQGAAITGPRGRSGGAVLRANVAGNAGPTVARFGWVNLAPGKYRFLLDAVDDGTAGRFRNYIAGLGVRYLNDPGRILEDTTSGTDLGRAQFCPLFLSEEFDQLVLSQNIPAVLKLELTLPEDPTPWLGGRVTGVNPPSLAAVADLDAILGAVVTTADLASIPDLGTLDVDLTVPGTVPGQRATAIPSTDLGGLSYTVSTPAADTVRVTLQNNTGAAVDLGATTWSVQVQGPTVYTQEVTVSGCKAGRRAVAMFEELPLGVDLEAEVIGADTVRVTFANRTGSTVDLGSGDLYAFVEEDPIPMDKGSAFVASRWTYQVQLEVSKDGTSECVISNPRLIHWDL